MVQTLDEQSRALEAEYGEPIKVETVPCEHSQWNHPRPANEPWVDDDGRCSICGEKVGYRELEPPRPHQYTKVAIPHTRIKRWYAIADDELIDWAEYMKYH